MRIARYCCLLIFFVSCSKSKFPDDVMQPGKMQAVFWDIIRADVLTTDHTKKDSSKMPMLENIALQKKIFRVHGVTKEQFYKSFDYYAKHPDLMTTLLDSMVAKENRNKIKSQIKGIKDYE